jgi:hypothetical protein
LISASLLLPLLFSNSTPSFKPIVATPSKSINTITKRSLKNTRK